MTALAEQPTTSRSIFRRPTAETGWLSWLTTVDHKKIGIMYFVTAMFFFVVGGIEALLIRAQLAVPNGQVLTAEQYNQIFTMHGLTMIFFAVMPLGSAFFNYLLPLMIGARDVAFPRLNAFSYWVFLGAGVFLYSSVFLGGLPDCGWFCYAPLSVIGGDPAGYTVGGSTVAATSDQAFRMVFYSVGLQIAGIASLASAVNFIVTILNMRAPGMTLMRMPVFIWMVLVVSFLMLFAMPVIGVALWQLMMDTAYSGNFFNPATGGDPVLWQHMFWLFGHPEVYILILPAFGIVSEILPTFARKPLFGYTAVVFSGIAIGLIGWGVWAHHMFAVGLGPVANTAFGLSTMVIAVPTGIKIFNWIGTLWGGRIRLTTPLLFAVGLVAMFTIGGLSGVTHSVVPHDWQQHDTYYVVAHFHYVLFGGAIFGLFAGTYYWFPKVTGRMMNERLGKAHFVLQLIGFNLTFAPMHILGLNGMVRRIATYDTAYGWNFWNLVVSIGSVVIALGVAVFIINLVVSAKRGKRVGHDPWDARTIEWLTTSPPPPHNFDVVPNVRARDELWHRKYTGDAPKEPVRVPAGASADYTAEDVVDPGVTAPSEGTTGAAFAPQHASIETAGYDEGRHGEHVHMPSPSWYPAVAALGLVVAAYGVILAVPSNLLFFGVGGLLTFGGLFGWVLEPSAEEHHQDVEHRRNVAHS
jgi:cytochrome c oxidase subunit 1